jgi:hypothetical protein
VETREDDVTGRGRKLGLALALGALLAALLSACFSSTPTFDGSTDTAPLVHATLVSDGTDRYLYSRDGASLAVSSPATNTGGQLRQVFYPADGPVRADEQSCATWTAQTGTFDQQGIALRIARTADGHGTRAVTVTKNIWELGFWRFNVHVWNSTAAHPFKLLATVNLSSVVGPDVFHLVSMPWHVCARVSGLTFRFVVWTGSNAQPGWDDTRAVHRVRLPAGWSYPGRAGWYIGHLGSGNVDTFTDLQTWTATP